MKAFRLLQEGLTASAYNDLQMPQCDVYSDQIVWSRSPVRIDLAGGWTDTPPYCLMEGGSVVNIAIELNGQQPIQVYVKPTTEFHIILRSIDLGAYEEIATFEDVCDFKKVGSPFSIPKAALALAGFVPRFCQRNTKRLSNNSKTSAAEWRSRCCRRFPPEAVSALRQCSRQQCSPPYPISANSAGTKQSSATRH